MNSDTKTDEQDNRLSRRDFLKLGALGAATPLEKLLKPENPANLVRYFIENPDGNSFGHKGLNFGYLNAQNAVLLYLKDGYWNEGPRHFARSDGRKDDPAKSLTDVQIAFVQMTNNSENKDQEVQKTNASLVLPRGKSMFYFHAPVSISSQENLPKDAHFLYREQNQNIYLTYAPNESGRLEVNTYLLPHPVKSAANPTIE